MSQNMNQSKQSIALEFTKYTECCAHGCVCVWSKVKGMCFLNIITDFLNTLYVR